MSGKESILIVGRNERTCATLARIFEGTDYDTETAATGREAIEKAQERFFNLALLDIELSDMEGTELMAELQEMHPDLVAVVITGSAAFEKAVQALNGGASAYVMKPPDADEVLVAVRKSLERQRLVADNRRLLESAKQELAERKKAVQALEASEGSLRKLVASNADGIVIVDKKGIVHFANPAAEELFGRAGKEFLGQAIGFPVAAGKAVECKITRPRGETTTAEMSVVEIDWEGKSVYLASVRDITQRKRAEEELKRSSQKMRKLFEKTIGAIASAVEEGDPYLAGHQRRVAQLACAIARELGLPEDQIYGIRIASLVHDIGKLQVPTEILEKPGQLTKSEYDIIKSHCRVGYNILKTIDFPWPVAQVVLQHHERINGSGYPMGISKENILLEARILAVADIVEAMTHPRPHRPPFGTDEALEVISESRDLLHDPRVVDACLKLFAEGFQFKDET